MSNNYTKYKSVCDVLAVIFLMQQNCETKSQSVIANAQKSSKILS